MMVRTDIEHLPWPMRQDLHRITAMLFETFAETTKGRLSDRYRQGRILKLILHGPQTRPDWHNIVPGEAFHLLAIVNHPRLARREQDWRFVRDRLRRAWEVGEIAHPVRLAVHSLEQVNGALTEGIPFFITVATEGIALYALDGTRLKSARPLPASERRARGLAEYGRWHGRASNFLLGAAFFQDRGNAPMAALLLHQACEHLYQCVAWSLTLHGVRTHALDQLREVAETLDTRLCSAWPRETSFERRAFSCLRRAYVEVRYGHSYRISAEELAWTMERVAVLQRLVQDMCRERLEDLVPLDLPHPLCGSDEREHHAQL
ncbi:DNA-binding protein [Sphingobium aromaticiconvertens]|uniref:HEPN domain-containing protein n=1 Tax=Sphingobium aromaticiconvertens TaxID=365341 RepID=UPI003019D816